MLAQIPLLTVGRGVLTAPWRRAEDSPPCQNSFPFDPFRYERRQTPEIELADGVKCGGEQTVRVVVTRATWEKVAPKIRPKDDVKPEAIYEDVNVMEVEHLIDALKAAGKKFEYKIYQAAPGGHEFNRIDTALAKASRKEAYDFLARYLK